MKSEIMFDGAIMECPQREAGKFYKGDCVPDIKFRGNVIGELIHDGVQWNFRPAPNDSEIKFSGYNPEAGTRVIGYYGETKRLVSWTGKAWVAMDTLFAVYLDPPDWWEYEGTGLKISPFKIPGSQGK